MIINNLNKSLDNLNVQIINNLETPDFSDFVLVHNKSRVIGYGWKTENIKKNVGFWGWALPALGANTITSFRVSESNLDFEEVINLFQFALSDDFYWFSPPTNRQNAGFSCSALSDVQEIYDYIKLFVESNFDPTVFLNSNLKWNWPK
jgi:hypothetical protein